MHCSSLLGTMPNVNPPEVTSYHPRNVHFNPIVSQLRYHDHHQKYEEEDQDHHENEAPIRITSFRVGGQEGWIDKNRNKNDMKNGTSKNESFPIISPPSIHNSTTLTVQKEKEAEKVQKVVVSFVANPPIINNSSLLQTQKINQTPLQEFQRNRNENVPDILKTTPLFNRKPRRVIGKAKSESVRQQASPKNLSFSPPPPPNLSSSSSWLVHQLSQLKKRLVISKKITTVEIGTAGSIICMAPPLAKIQTGTSSTAEQNNGNKYHQHLDLNREERNPVFTKLNVNRNPEIRKNLMMMETEEESFSDVENKDPVLNLKNDICRSTNDNKMEQSPAADESRNCPELVNKRPLSNKNSSTSFNYQTAFNSLRTKDATDELSANVDKILDEISCLENIMDDSYNCSITNNSPIFTSTPKITRKLSKQLNEDEDITELVKECCSVSSALSCLTASANSLSTLTTPPTSPISQGKLASTKPPIPPQHLFNNKYLNSVLRKQFLFRPSPFIPDVNTSSSRLTPLKGKPLSGQQCSHEFELVDNKLSEVKEELYRSREQLSRSRLQPNLVHEIIDNCARSMAMIDRFTGRNPNSADSGWESCSSTTSTPTFSSLLHLENSTNNDQHTTTTTKYDKENIAKQCQWNEIVTQVKEKLVVSSPSSSFGINNFSSNVGDLCPRKKFNTLGILETDLDTGASRELFKSDSHSYYPSSSSAAARKETVLLSTDSKRVVKPLKQSHEIISKFVQKNNTCSSMQNLNLSTMSSTLSPSTSASKEDRSRSMEFLLDDEKHAQLMPPENTLQKENRQASEHELRIQRSLSRLNVPDWYKKYATPTTPTNKTTNRDFGSGLAGGWSGLSSSKTASLTSLQSAGRYAGSKTGFSSARRGPTPTGGRSSRESLMSPSSTASASPSPYFERSYGMPYALSRFSTRMSCGASPASLSPSPSPIYGISSSTSTPVSSCPTSRYGYNKTPYLGWRSQERLNSKTLYRSPSERLAADLLSHQKQTKVTTPVSNTGSNVSIVTSPRKETASDLSLNISDTSESSNKLNRVRSSIKEVSNAIVDYVNETKPLDEGINGRASPRRGLVWLESSFVGTKPIDSPGTPDTIMSKHLATQGSAYLHGKRSAMKGDHHNGDNSSKGRSSENTQAFSTYLSRNEKAEKESNSTSMSVSSPVAQDDSDDIDNYSWDDILDSLLALRRPHKKIRDKGHKPDESTTTTITTNPLTIKDDIATTQPFFTTSVVPDVNNPYDIPVSDWQQRMNQPLDDTMYFPQDGDSFLLPDSSSIFTSTIITSLTTTTTTTGKQ